VIVLTLDYDHVDDIVVVDDYDDEVVVLLGDSGSVREVGQVEVKVRNQYLRDNVEEFQVQEEYDDDYKQRRDVTNEKDDGVDMMVGGEISVKDDVGGGEVEMDTC